jgi:hypothetical protein
LTWRPRSGGDEAAAWKRRRAQPDKRLITGP